MKGNAETWLFPFCLLDISQQFIPPHTTVIIATQAPAMGVKAVNGSTNHELDPLKLSVKAKLFLLTQWLSQVHDYSDGKMTKATA